MGVQLIDHLLQPEFVANLCKAERICMGSGDFIRHSNEMAVLIGQCLLFSRQKRTGRGGLMEEWMSNYWPMWVENVSELSKTMLAKCRDFLLERDPFVWQVSGK